MLQVLFVVHELEVVELVPEEGELASQVVDVEFVGVDVFLEVEFLLLLEDLDLQVVVEVVHERDDVGDFGACVDGVDQLRLVLPGALGDALVEFVDLLLDFAHLVLHPQLLDPAFLVGIELFFLTLEHFDVRGESLHDVGLHVIECLPLRLDRLLVHERLQPVLFYQVFRELVLLVDLADLFGLFDRLARLLLDFVFEGLDGGETFFIFLHELVLLLLFQLYFVQLLLHVRTLGLDVLLEVTYLGLQDVRFVLE